MSIKEENRSNRQSESVANYIYLGEVLFENYKKTPEILEVCNNFGYTEERINEGRALLDELKSKIKNKEDKLSFQLEASSDLGDALSIANKIYVKNLQIARICFKDDYSIKRFLNLDGSREQIFSKQVDEIRRFYENVVRDDVILGMSKFGITAEVVAEDKKTFDRVLEFDAVQEQRKKELKVATNEKQEAFDKYKKWIGELKKILKLNFKNLDDLLEGVLI